MNYEDEVKAKLAPAVAQLVLVRDVLILDDIYFFERTDGAVTHRSGCSKIRKSFRYGRPKAVRRREQIGAKGSKSFWFHLTLSHSVNLNPEAQGFVVVSFQSRGAFIETEHDQLAL